MILETLPTEEYHNIVGRIDVVNQEWKKLVPVQSSTGENLNRFLALNPLKFKVSSVLPILPTNTVKSLYNECHCGENVIYPLPKYHILFMVQIFHSNRHWCNRILV
jgi:hypothetical protein